jgi:hypothetical protein
MSKTFALPGNEVKLILVRRTDRNGPSSRYHRAEGFELLSSGGAGSIAAGRADSRVHDYRAARRVADTISRLNDCRRALSGSRSQSSLSEALTFKGRGSFDVVDDAI